MSKTIKDPVRGEPVILCQLALERCQTYLSHLCALWHMSCSERSGDAMVTDNFLDLVCQLEKELTASAQCLQHIE